MSDGEREYSLHAEGPTVGDVGERISRIYVALDGRRAKHQYRMIEIAGKIAIVPINIQIDSEANQNYITPNLIETCHLNKSKLEVTTMVQ